jgi:hypothetical protein
VYLGEAGGALGKVVGGLVDGGYGREEEVEIAVDNSWFDQSSELVGRSYVRTEVDGEDHHDGREKKHFCWSDN